MHKPVDFLLPSFHALHMVRITGMVPCGSEVSNPGICFLFLLCRKIPWSHQEPPGGWANTSRNRSAIWLFPPHLIQSMAERSPESTFPWTGVKWAEDGPGLEAPGQVGRATPGGDPLASTPWWVQAGGSLEPQRSDVEPWNHDSATKQKTNRQQDEAFLDCRLKCGKLSE